MGGTSQLGGSARLTEQCENTGHQQAHGMWQVAVIEYICWQVNWEKDLEIR